MMSKNTLVLLVISTYRKLSVLIKTQDTCLLVSEWQAPCVCVCLCVCVCVCEREQERERERESARDRERQNERDGEEVFVSYQALRVEARQDKLRNDKCRICYLN